MSSSRDQRRAMYEQLVGSAVAQGRFRVTRLLGFGGMGAVYEAVQTNMDRSVALKLIPTHDPTTVARFEREALNTSKLRHPNTVTVFDFGSSDGRFLYLAMELLEGHTLTELIEKDGPLRPDRAVHIASQMCRSLNEAHRQGIVHRDIKPDNIFLIRVDNDPDVVKILDFGIAKAVIGDDDVQLTGDGRIIGTPRYMSPEQILAESLDHRSDIYSLGCILFEMLCGAPPFQQSSTTALMISHTQDPPPGFAQRLSREQIAAMPGYLEHVVMKALAKDPNDRFQTVEEMRAEMERALNSAPAQVNLDEIDADSTAASLPSHITGTGPSGPSRMPGHSAPQPTPQQPQVVRKDDTSSGPPKVAIVGIIVLLIVLMGIVAVALLKEGGDGEAVADVEKTAPKVVAKTEPVKPKVEEKPAEKPAANPKWTSIEFRTTPPGAEVVRNGEATGSKTPTMLALPPGQPSKMVFKLSGYEDYVAEVVPTEGEVFEVNLVKSRSSNKVRVRNTGSKSKDTKPAETKPKEEEKKAPVVEMLEDETPNVNLLD